MELPTHILLVYGYLLLFGWVLVEQLGVPLPATPVLLAAGALTAQHDLNYVLALASAVAAAIVADTAWFLVGRHYGHHVLNLLCRMSLEPSICVRKTQNSFGSRGAVTLLFAKFVPGLSTVAPPIAGQNGMGFSRFLFFDGVGSIVWVGALLTGGRLFGDALKRDPSLLDWVGRFSGALLVLGIVGFFLSRIVRRRNFIQKLEKARLDPEDLKRQLDAGDPVFIVDLRHPLELVPEPYTLPGALHVSPEALSRRLSEIPRDRDVVLYCTCPNEATAAKTAMTLHKAGIDRVRPLRGGFDEWKRLGYPLDQVTPPALQPDVVEIAPAM